MSTENSNAPKVKPHVFQPTNMVELLVPPFGRYEVESVEPPNEDGVQVLFLIHGNGGTFCDNTQVRLSPNP